jgi:hypothetical protein
MRYANGYWQTKLTREPLKYSPNQGTRRFDLKKRVLFCKSLCLIDSALRQYRRMESRGVRPPFLTTPLDAGERSASRARRFNPREMAAGTQ